MPGTLAQHSDWPGIVVHDQPAERPRRRWGDLKDGWRELTIDGADYRVRLEGERVLAKRKRLDDDDDELHIWERCEAPSNRALVLALLGEI